MFCDPSFEAIRSTNNVLGPGPNLNAAITVDNDMVASLLLFPSTVRSVAAETLYNTNNFQKITGDSYKVRHTNSKSEWQLHSPRVSRHPYQRQYVHKGSLARAANVVSSLRSVQRPTLGGLTRAADTTSLLLGDLDAASFQCLRPTSTHSDHLRTVAPVPATNTSTGQLLVPPVQINQALVIPAGLVGQSQILTRSSDQLSLGTQLANPASIVQMGSSVTVMNPLPLSSFVNTFELPTAQPVSANSYPLSVDSASVPNLNSIITPNVSPLPTTFADSASLFPASLDGTSAFGMGHLDFNSLMLSVGGNQSGFSFFPPMETATTTMMPADPITTVTLNGGLPSPLTTDFDLVNLTAFTGNLSALDGIVTAVPMSNVSPPLRDGVNVDCSTTESVTAGRALSPQAEIKLTAECTRPDEHKSIEGSPERHRESSECSEFLLVDDDESESADSGSEYEFPTKSGSSRRGRQGAGRRSGQKQSALDHRRSSIVSNMSEISCVSSCDSEYSAVGCNKRQQRQQANSKRKQQEEDCESDKRRHWTCEQCGKRFTRKFNLGQHMRIHSGRKPYVCQVENCGMAFVRDYDRKRHHISVHDEDKPFKCTHCDLQFPRKDAYHRHLTKVGLM